MEAVTSYPDILTGKKSVAPYPMEKVRRVDRITTEISGEIKRIDLRQTGFAQASTGGLGPTTQKQFFRHVDKMPLARAMIREVGPAFAPLRDGEVFPTRAPLPDDPKIVSAHIKNVGYFLKAQFVGICELPQWALYTHDLKGNPIECNHKYAIVLISEWDYETMHGSRGDDWITGSESFLTYNASAHMAATLAGYIRRLGYPARASFQSGPISTYDMVVTPLVVLSGLGELGRGGWALNPFISGRFKSSVVTTDLPLQPDRPIDFGLQEFCRVCKKCAIQCPSKAISASDDKVEHNGYKSWPIDWARCTKYRASNQNGMSCGKCVKVCPWNKPEGPSHDLVRWMIEHAPAINPLLVKMDDLLGYGKQDISYKWWFDFEEFEGTHRIAPKSVDNTLWQVQEERVIPDS